MMPLTLLETSGSHWVRPAGFSLLAAKEEPKPLVAKLAKEVAKGWVLIFRGEVAFECLPNVCLSTVYLTKGST